MKKDISQEIVAESLAISRDILAKYEQVALSISTFTESEKVCFPS
jgi:hypothetical protein